MLHGEILLATDDQAEAEARPPRSLDLKAATPERVYDHRLEDWIAGNLDADLDFERAETNLWNQLVGNLPTARRSPRSGARSDRGFQSRGAWNRFSVLYKRGVAIVRMTDRSLIKQSEIRELADDLDDLIGVGNQRVVLNFSKVERLGSWIVAAVVEAHRRCEGAEGGRLKVCGLSRQLSEIFEIIGMGRRIVRCDDEQAAVDGPWPPSPGPRALPVDILEALVDASTLPPIRGGSPVDVDARASVPETATEAEPLKGKVWMRVEHGPSQGPMLAVAAPSFDIGRGQESRFRLASPHVSKRHAVVEIRGGRVFLRDLGSTNGTVLNGDLLRASEVELHSQDTFQIGKARFTIWIGLTRAELEYVGLVAPATSEPGQPSADVHPADPSPTEDAPMIGAESPTAESVAEPDPNEIRIKCEVVQNVLVVTPIVIDFEGEEANEALRLKLHELSEHSYPRRVVIDLEFVGRLTRRTIGVLLAHHLRLDRVGGGLRICEAHPRIMAMLDQVRLTLLVDCYPSLDEAVLAAWTPHAPNDAAST